MGQGQGRGRGMIIYLLPALHACFLLLLHMFYFFARCLSVVLMTGNNGLYVCMNQG